MDQQRECDDIDQREGVSPNLRLKNNNNILSQAIFDNHRSVAEFCRQNPPLGQTAVGNLLRFKESPFKADGTYRKVCYHIERATRISVEVLFDEELYGKATGSENRIEISSFADLPGAVEKEVQALPTPAESPVEVIRKTNDIELDIEKVLNMLSDPERVIIKLRFGLGERGSKEYTRKELAKIYKVKEFRIQQIEARAINKLRELHAAPLVKYVTGRTEEDED